MNILIPINHEKKLCSINENSSWVVVTIDGGKTKKLEFFNTKDEIDKLIDYAIVISKDESINDFFLDGMEVLIAPMQRSIEDIVEAYMFCELNEVTS